MENYQITREQILSAYESKEKLKELFPDVFELQVGKWYRVNTGRQNYLLLFSGLNCSPGFMDGKWLDDWSFTKDGNHKHAEEATKEEVFEALKNEAVKRGFVDGAVYTNTGGRANLIVYKLHFGHDGLHSAFGDGMIFSRGKWATIVETITKKEAEKLLNKKIID